MFKRTPRSSSPMSFNDNRSHEHDPVKFPLLSKFKDNDFLLQTGNSTRSLLEPIYKMGETSITNDNNKIDDHSDNRNKNEDVSR